MRWLFWADAKPQNGNYDDTNRNRTHSNNDLNRDLRRNENLEPKANHHDQNPPLTSESSLSSARKDSKDWNALIHAINWKQFTEPQTVIPTLVMTGGILFSIHIYRKYLRRIPEVANISPTFFRRRTLLGQVTSVGDGDNFRMYHTPGGLLAGWGWLRTIPTSKKELKNRTIHIRLAGVDAPELAHFGRPSQPFAQEAHTWLTNRLMGRRVRARVYRADQYGRVVATVHARRFLFFPQDIGLQMLKSGVATVYEAKSGVEFGGEALEKKYRDAESEAKRKRRGLWKEATGSNASEWESPREFKSRMMGMERKEKE
ncbi:putative endonuclease lcl3 [Myotisia sp. PD_48]|nr:putative endonuclease lcl3 [Myotisia sp. PD_48]